MQRRKFIMMGTHNNQSSRFLSDSASSNAINNPSKKRVRHLITCKTLYITEGFIKQTDKTMIYFKSFSQNKSLLDIPAEEFAIPQNKAIKLTVNNTLTTDHSFVIDGLIDSGVIKAGTSKTLYFTADKAGDYLFYDGLNAPFNRLSGLQGGITVISPDNESRLCNKNLKTQHLPVIYEIDPIWHNDFKNNFTPTTPFTPLYFLVNGISKKSLSTTLPPLPNSHPRGQRALYSALTPSAQTTQSCTG